MRRSILNSLVLLTAISVLGACKAKKAVVVAPPAVKTAPAVTENRKAENIKLLKSKDYVFNTLSLRGKANLDINGNSNNVNMNIRIQKDEKIWVSITAIAGLEVARAVITPDSLMVLNRLQSTYIRKPFNYIYRFTNKQVDFAMLQSVLSGNTINALVEESSELQSTGGVWVVSGKKADLAYRVLYNTLLKSSETTLNDAKSGQAFKVAYGEYQQVNNSLFPSSFKINTLAGTKKINIDLSFSKIESNLPLEFPFSVPKRFELIN